MTISNELRATIQRYHYIEKWPIGTIASQLNLHHSTVKRVLLSTGIELVETSKQKRPQQNKNTMIEPYLPFILRTLERHPNLTAARLYTMVKERGYPGKSDHFRYLVSLHRPRPSAEAYQRLRTLAGEQAQVDWGHFGSIVIGDAKRSLNAFVMVLSYSRKIYLHFFLNQRIECFLSGHEQAFQAFGGIPRIILYDNLKSAVLERKGDAIRFNPTLLDFAGHYHFEPRPVAVARGNEKGRVERAIRYIRHNFFAARSFENIDDLNKQALMWCEDVAAERVCPEDKKRSVKIVFEEEQSSLLALPDNPYPCHESTQVKVGKTPYIRFDLNDYSVPHTYVRRLLSVCATVHKVVILDGMTVIAEHTRSYDRGQQIENGEHIEALTEQKKKARLHRSQDRLTKALSHASAFLTAAAHRGYPLRSILSELTKLLDLYGAATLDAALREVMSRDVPHPNAVRLELQRLRDLQNQPPPVVLDLSKDKRVCDLVVKPHALENYDILQTKK